MQMVFPQSKVVYFLYLVYGRMVVVVVKKCPLEAYRTRVVLHRTQTVWQRRCVTSL